MISTRRNVSIRAVSVAFVIIGLMACKQAPETVASIEPGVPLAGLTATQLARFVAGEALFNKVYSPEEGLGPIFNENQCSACHTFPASGGTGEQRVRKATRFDQETGCDRLTEVGGENIRSQATPLLLAHGIEDELRPPEATDFGVFTPTFLFGLGLVEMIPPETVLARADPTDADGDGVSGRASRAADGQLGRFGRKAEVATIFDFVESALRLEMGLTTPLNPKEEGVSGEPFPDGTDPTPEPEVDLSTIALLADYIRFLAPPEREVPISVEGRQAVVRGEQMFDGLGCLSCHVPSMQTGPSDVTPLDQETVALYSDLLLHDLGPELADVCGITATPSELRTGILMGLRYRNVYLHHGRALSIRDAILRHGGEAQRARDAFAALNRVTQEYLIQFLQTL